MRTTHLVARRKSRPADAARLAALAVCGLLAASSSADAYVRSRAASCKATYLAQTCVYIQADSAYVKDMAPADIEQAIQNAVNAWQSQTSPASFLLLKHLPAQGPLEVTYKDGLQVIKFRSDTRCRPPTDGAQQVCYDASATAITTVSYVNKAGDPTDGQIVDADIELNAVNNLFFNADKGKPLADPRNPADLWNTLAHEMGHMQGMDHTCRSLGEPATGCTVDNKGAQRPLCSNVNSQHLTNPAYAIIFQTTMYAVANPGEITKRIPHADDVQAITDSYPVSSDPKSCVLPGLMTSGGGCSCTLGAGTPSWPRTSVPLGLTAVSLMLSMAVSRRRLHGQACKSSRLRSQGRCGRQIPQNVRDASLSASEVSPYG